MVERKVYTVSELTRCIKTALEREIGEIWLEAESSNVRQPASGHLYFTIKDETAQVRAVMFRGNQRQLRFRLRDGLSVRAFGEVSVYERSGEYQVIVRHLEEGGQGSLQKRFEELKKQLQKEGLFDEARKQALPLLPRHVGVVTSRTGAAVRDILNVVTRRFPNLHVLIAPVRVQGEGAAAEVAAAIDLLNERGGLDVLIVGRGGGSLEDLWAFNEEAVARAVARSRIPVISAVGHEIDYTICDFVADLRAPTPSVAAELVVGRKDAFEEALDGWRRRLANALHEPVLRWRNRLTAARGSYVFREPAHRVEQFRQRLTGLGVRMGHEMRARRHDGAQRVDDGALRLARAIDLQQQLRRREIERISGQLRALDPLAVLGRGYSMTRDAKGRIVRLASELRQGQTVVTRLASGAFEATVTSAEAPRAT